jgi:hypothetical protein
LRLRHNEVDRTERLANPCGPRDFFLADFLAFALKADATIMEVRIFSLSTRPDLSIELWMRIADERDRPYRDRRFRQRDRADRKAGLALRMTSTTRAMLAGFGRRDHARAPDEHAHDQGRFTT